MSRLKGLAHIIRTAGSLRRKSGYQCCHLYFQCKYGSLALGKRSAFIRLTVFLRLTGARRGREGECRDTIQIEKGEHMTNSLSKIAQDLSEISRLAGQLLSGRSLKGAPSGQKQGNKQPSLLKG